MSQNTPQKWFSLEERFFSEVDHDLVEKLRADMETAESAEAISHATGLQNAELTTAMAKLKVSVETLAAFRLVPLVAVAWADDRIEENERWVITKSAEKSGITEGEPAMKLLESWTKKRPPSELLDAWCEYAKALSASLAEPHREALKEETVSAVHAVAEANGGFLGYGSVSPSEHSTIKRIEEALS